MSLIRNMRGKIFSKYIFENSLFIRAYLQYIYFSGRQDPATTMAALLLDERKTGGRFENPGRQSEIYGLLMDQV